MNKLIQKELLGEQIIKEKTICENFCNVISEVKKKSCYFSILKVLVESLVFQKTKHRNQEAYHTMQTFGLETMDKGTEAGDPFSSSSDALDVIQSFSFSTGDKLTE